MTYARSSGRWSFISAALGSNTAASSWIIKSNFTTLGNTQTLIYQVAVNVRHLLQRRSFFPSPSTETHWTLTVFHSVFKLKCCYPAKSATKVECLLYMALQSPWLLQPYHKPYCFSVWLASGSGAAVEDMRFLKKRLWIKQGGDWCLQHVLQEQDKRVVITE